MSFNTQQQKLGISFVPQGSLHTANVADDFWNLSKTNGGFGQFAFNYESDAEDIGKGSEFATQLFPTTKDVSFSIEKRLSSQIAAWLFAFGFGTANLTTAAEGSGGTKYTITPMDVCDGLDLPAFSVVEQLGAGCPGGTPLDRMAAGCVLNSFGISFQSGPGRNNTLARAEIVGCGHTTEPSGITLPAALSEATLSGSSATVTLNGTDYVANKALLSLDMNFANNVRTDSGYFIGSGSQDGASLRGRMERGNRVYTLSFVARLESGSTELSKLKAGTSGTGSVVLTGAEFESGKNHKLTVSYPKLQYQAVEVGDDNGITTVQVNVAVLEHASNGICSAEIITTASGIGATD